MASRRLFFRRFEFGGDALISRRDWHCDGARHLPDVADDLSANAFANRAEKRVPFICSLYVLYGLETSFVRADQSD